MGRKKGQAPDSYVNGKLIPLNERSPEERKRISQMGVEARKKKKEERMALQNVMRELLNMRTNSDKSKQLLRNMGFTDEELTNQSLLMVALFKKGLTGDVSAIKEITQMMEKLEMFKQTGKVQQSNNVTINLVTQGESYTPTEEDEQEIWDVENSEEWMEEEEEWGTEVYNG